MVWAAFFHIYQPFDQDAKILDSVVNQSYRKILATLKNKPSAKVTLNISGALTELLDNKGYKDVISDLKLLSERGQIEFTSSAKYHALLPLLNEEEIVRQIKINNETNKFYLGESYKPQGFFPPEMGYDIRLAKIVEELGFKWLILDEIACGGRVGNVDYSKTYKITDTNLQVFFRERRLSNLIMSAMVRSCESLLESMKAEITSNKYIVTAMDGETFGHHRPGLENLLDDIFSSSQFSFIKISELVSYYKGTISVVPVASTWASSEQDIENNVQFLSWRDPVNDIHQWQWEFLTLAIDEIYKVAKSSLAYEDLRRRLDQSLASDQLFWASAKPWWSIEMIEAGAYRLLNLIKLIPNVKRDIIEKAQNYYEKIVSTAFEWKRSGKIATITDEVLRIPFKDRTLFEKGKENVYYAFLYMMQNLEKKAVEHKEYEKAILWRDAIYKLENGFDIYDSINAIDLVRVDISNKEVEDTIKKFEKDYHRIRGGQPEQRGS